MQFVPKIIESPAFAGLFLFLQHVRHLHPYPFLQVEMRLLRVLFVALIEAERAVFGGTEGGNGHEKTLPQVGDRQHDLFWRWHPFPAHC